MMAEGVPPSNSLTAQPELHKRLLDTAAELAEALGRAADSLSCATDASRWVVM